MSNDADPSLGDVIRSVHATGEDRFGVEPGGNRRDSARVRPVEDDEDEEDQDSDR